MIEELRKELKEQIEENKELNDSVIWWKNRYEAQVKINEEHKKLNGELRKENDALITIFALVREYIERNMTYETCERKLCTQEGNDLLEILERVNEEWLKNKL